jgi:hypothetical protein
MTLAPDFTFSNGTVPDADEVQAVLNQLFNRANRTKVVGVSSTSTATRSTAGTTTSTLSGTSQTFTVDEDSVLLVGMSGLVVADNKTGEWQATFNLLVDGTPQVVQPVGEDHDLDVGGITKVATTFPVTRIAAIGLTAGSHTLAVQAVVDISRALGVLGGDVEAGWVSWGGLVIPA